MNSPRRSGVPLVPFALDHPAGHVLVFTAITAHIGSSSGTVLQLARPLISLVSTLPVPGVPPVILIVPAISSLAVLVSVDVPIHTLPFVAPAAPIPDPYITFPREN